MKQNKLMIAALVILLLLNIAMLIFILRSKNHSNGKQGGNHGSPFEMMTKELNLNDSEQASLKKMREEHFAAIKPVFDSIHSIKKLLFGLIKQDNATDSAVAHYSSLIAEQQSIADKLTIAHFRKVRASLNSTQQQKFDEFVEKMFVQRHTPGSHNNNDSSHH